MHSSPDPCRDVAPARRSAKVERAFQAVSAALSACANYFHITRQAWERWGSCAPRKADFPPGASHYVLGPRAAVDFRDRALSHGVGLGYEFNGPPTPWQDILMNAVHAYRWLNETIPAALEEIKAARIELRDTGAGNGLTLDVALLSTLRALHSFVHPETWGEDGLARIVTSRFALPEDWHVHVQRLEELYRILFDLEAPMPLPQPDGWSVETLCREAEIGRTLFVEIAREAGIPRARSGDHGFRHSVRDLTQLVDVCDKADPGKRKWRQAGVRWAALLAASTKRSES